MALNIADLFEHSVDLVPHRTAVLCGERRLTYAELEERANRLAHHLARHGVGPGSHVGVYLRNRAEALETMLAAYKLRAVAININYRPRSRHSSADTQCCSRPGSTPPKYGA
jgi:acyl-CoA synthetase (AMP-forming)/AMP-acid ligase II